MKERTPLTGLLFFAVGFMWFGSLYIPTLGIVEPQRMFVFAMLSIAVTIIATIKICSMWRIESQNYPKVTKNE